jgi:hypothetical protein
LNKGEGEGEERGRPPGIKFEVKKRGVPPPGVEFGMYRVEES